MKAEILSEDEVVDEYPDTEWEECDEGLWADNDDEYVTYYIVFLDDDGNCSLKTGNDCVGYGLKYAKTYEIACAVDKRLRIVSLRNNLHYPLPIVTSSLNAAKNLSIQLGDDACEFLSNRY